MNKTSVRARVDLPQLARGRARNPEGALREREVVRVTAEDREAVLPTPRFRIDALHEGPRIESTVTHPDRARPDRDLTGQLGAEAFRREFEGLDLLVHARVDASKCRRVPVCHPDRPLADGESARLDP